MKPNKLTATGIKTGGISLELAALTLVTGDNGKGKTQIADAIRLALLGYHPTLGSRNAEIMKLSNGNVLEVDLDGVRRTWTRKGRSVSCEANEAAVALDKDRGFSPVILDFESFLNAKATARREILEAVLPPSNPAEILQEINAKLVSEAVEEEFEETPDFVSLVKSAGDKGREWKQELARIKGSIESLGIEIAELPCVTADVPASPESFQGRRDEIRGILVAARTKLESIEKAVRDAPSRPEGVRVLPETVDALKDALDAEKRKQEANAKTESKNRELKRDLVNLTVDREKTYQLAPTGTSRDKPTTARDPNHALALKAFDEKLAKLDREIAAEESVLKGLGVRVGEIRDQVTSLESSGCCPTCGASEAVLAETIEKILQPRLDEFLDLVKISEAKIVALHDDRELCSTDRIDANDLEASWVAFDAVTLRDEINEKVKVTQAAFVETEPDRYDETLRDLRDAEAGLAEWSKWVLAGEVDQSEVPTLKSEIEAAEQNLADVDQRVEEAKSRQAFDLKVSNLNGSLKTAKEELEAAKKKVAAFKDLGTWAKTRSLEVTAARLTPLLDPANSILNGVLAGSLAIDGTDIGVELDGVFRPIEVLSGAESAAVAAAIQVALAANGKLPFVILDELSRLVWDRKLALVRNLRAAIDSNLIAGALVLDHDHGFASTASAEFEGKLVEA